MILQGISDASFNAEMSAQGYAVVSVGPLYAFCGMAIELFDLPFHINALQEMLRVASEEMLT